MKAQMVRVEINKPGRGELAIELGHCPIQEHGICRLELIKCNYGRTEIRVPLPVCPMSNKSVVTLKFRAI